jgi:hypothetical protein
MGAASCKVIRSAYFGDGIDRADFNALGVIGALGLVDHVGTVLLGNGALGALWLAGAAGDADIRINSMWHVPIPFWFQARCLISEV